MNTKLSVLFSACLVSCLASAEQGSGGKEKQAGKPKDNLVLTLLGDRMGSTPVSLDNPVTFLFRNEGELPVYIFYFFEVKGKPYSLSVTIHNAEGKMVYQYVPTCKVELSHPLKYILLEKNELFRISFPFDKVAPRLPEGEYTVTGSYKNDKGRNCFKGELVSQPVKFIVKK